MHPFFIAAPIAFGVLLRIMAQLKIRFLELGG
ncbi:hypothetical protein PEC301296_13680 [Pectobacterium carotovorum subsp. carotovorum]|nr:hypothetical protein KCQ_17832 [Pectobacterium atrosepticum ICMP 1526]POW31934.1 hypothetical protein PB72LOC_00282 [Pectobacterium atrosepticum]GKV85056.1 hypothetical protein PEC301296_13680 [Pectobacterium carotovorum subsp. carotovorum]